jgi:hypothetical protein
MTTPFGNFSFVKREEDRFILEDAFQAMEKVRGSWNTVKEMSNETYNKFVGAEGYLPMDRVMDRLNYAEHNGSTINWVFYWIRTIAVSGWDEFVTKFIEAQRPTRAAAAGRV